MEQRISFPTATFLNLPPEKRSGIVRAALAEFAAQGYQRASVNSIARESGIAKGSLYQYFSNKEALFLHLFDQFTEKVKQHVRQAVVGQEGQDFFGVTRQVLLAALDFIDRYPEYYHIYLKVMFEEDVPQREDLVARVRLFSLDFFGPLCEQAREEGQLRHDVSCRQAIFIMDATMERFLLEYARPSRGGAGLGAVPRAMEDLHGEIDTIIGVLRHGLQPRHGR